VRALGVVATSVATILVVMLLVASSHAPGKPAFDRCADTCKGLSGRHEGVWLHHTNNQDVVTCHCVRDFEISTDGTQTKEVTP
jgi:hypothetical protein